MVKYFTAMVLHHLRCFFVWLFVLGFFPWGSDLTLVNGETAFAGSNFKSPNAPFRILKFQVQFSNAICDVTNEIHGLGR